MSGKDYYEALGVKKGSSKQQVKDAYRKLALQFHPDRNKDPQAEARFKEISEAYAVLSDDEKRKQYDAYGKEGVYQRYSPEEIFRGADFSEFFRGGGFGGFDDIFAQFFGGGQQRAGRGEDLTYHLQLKLEDVVKETSKEIEVPREEVCGNCKGSGARPGTSPRQCASCGGSGQVQRVQAAGFTRLVRITQCSKCGGRGYVVDSPCRECGGPGIISKTRRIRVMVPAGVEDGQTLRLRGEGNAGENGVPPGDLYVMVNLLPHPVFKRQDSDLFMETRIGVVEAINGSEIVVPTLYGEVSLSIPEGTQPGTVFKVKGKGLPNYGAWGKGDQYVKVNVQIPKRLTGAQRELLKNLGDVS
ncbi:MAG: molecular chaperone DnaJ [Thaumarchaeota archaeon]|nr:molecular chaperone DnaJ [Nitrososphaerota archaeon]